MFMADRAHALAMPHTMVISKKKSRQNTSRGKTRWVKRCILITIIPTLYRWRGHRNFPATSHLQYDFMVTLTGRILAGEQNAWGNMNYTTYLKLKPGTDAKAFERKCRLIWLKTISCRLL